MPAGKLPKPKKPEDKEPNSDHDKSQESPSHGEEKRSHNEVYPALLQRTRRTVMFSNMLSQQLWKE